jgi:hypothetical protein
VHPRTPGRYLLGVECDGATYHSSATARDRDRLRQKVLEDLGWRICRIWSTDWVRNRPGQVERVLESVRKAQLSPPSVRNPLTAPAPLPAFISTQGPLNEAQQPKARYDSIDDVPEKSLRDEILRVVGHCGATQPNELIQSVARALGFRRTGKKIQSRIEETIARLEQAESLTRMADGRLQNVMSRLPVQR